MAVENCTISTVSITALGGSTLVAGTKTLIITPDADFYVSASMCSVGNAMETFPGSNIWNTVGANVTTGITQVQFVDVGDGTVEAIITHEAISINSSTDDFFIDIDVTASPPRAYSCVKITTSHSQSEDGSNMSTSTHLDVSGMTETEISTGAEHIVTSSGEVSSTPGDVTLIGTMRFTAAAGFSFSTYPSGLPCSFVYSYAMNVMADFWQVTVSNYTYDGDYVTGFDVSVYYATPAVAIEGIESAAEFCNLNHQLNVRTKPQLIPTARARSYSVTGFSTPRQLEYNSGAQELRVFGVEGSRFNVFIQDEDGKFYDHSTGSFSHGKRSDGNGAAKGYFKIPRNGIFKTTLNYPRSTNAAKSYSYFVEGVYTPAKASVGGEAGVSKNLIDASTTSLASSVPTEESKTTITQYPRQRVQLKVTQSGSTHTIPTASSTGVSLYGITNQIQTTAANVEDSDVPYSGARKSLTKIDFSLDVQTGASGGKTWRATGRALQTSTLKYTADTNTVVEPVYYIENGTQTGSGDPDGSTVTFSGTLYVEKFGEVVGDGIYCLEIYLDDFIELH